MLITRKDFLAAKKQGIDPNAEYDENLRNAVAGQKAFPDESYGLNIGTNPDKALPQITKKKAEDASASQEESKSRPSKKDF